MKSGDAKQPDRQTCSGAGKRIPCSCSPRLNLSASLPGRPSGAPRGLTPAGRSFRFSQRLTKRILSTARLDSSRSKRLGPEIGARHAGAGFDGLELLRAGERPAFTGGMTWTSFLLQSSFCVPHLSGAYWDLFSERPLRPQGSGLRRRPSALPRPSSSASAFAR